MKFNKIILVAMFVVLFTTTLKAQGGKVNLESKLDSVAYVLGGELAKIFGEDLKDVNFDALKAGALDAQAGVNKLEGTNVNSLMQSYANEKAEKMKAKGEAWLAENAKKEGVTTTASGLQYEVITEGDGPQPTATDKVTVHYHGTIIDGTVFDSSVERGKPATFGLNQVIKGWTEGVQLMKTGSKYRFFIPSDLGYGANGQGGVIGPYEVLIFEVELISIEGK